jgi:hypothetical protein
MDENASPSDTKPAINGTRAREKDRESRNRNVHTDGLSRTVSSLCGTLSTCINGSPFFTARRGVHGMVESRPEVATRSEQKDANIEQCAIRRAGATMYRG